MRKLIFALVALAALGCEETNNNITAPDPPVPPGDVVVLGSCTPALTGCAIACKDESRDQDHAIDTVQWQASLAGVEVRSRTGDRGAQVLLDVSAYGSGAYTVRQTVYSRDATAFGAMDHPVSMECGGSDDV